MAYWPILKWVIIWVFQTASQSNIFQHGLIYYHERFDVSFTFCTVCTVICQTSITCVKNVWNIKWYCVIHMYCLAHPVLCKLKIGRTPSQYGYKMLMFYQKLRKECKIPLWTCMNQFNFRWLPLWKWRHHFVWRCFGTKIQIMIVEVKWVHEYDLSKGRHLWGR